MPVGLGFGSVLQLAIKGAMGHQLNQANELQQTMTFFRLP